MARSMSIFTFAGLLAILAAAPALAQRDDPSASFAAAQKAKGATASAAASELQRTYREPPDRIASLLLGAGYRAAPVLTALVVDLRFPLASATEDIGRGGASVVESGSAEAAEMAQALHDADYSASEVAEVLVELYDSSAEVVVTALRSAGYGDDQVVQALLDVFIEHPAATIGIFRRVGDSCSEAFLLALEGDHGPPQNLSPFVGLLYSSGCTRTEVKDALLGGLSAEHMALQLAALLEP